MNNKPSRFNADTLHKVIYTILGAIAIVEALSRVLRQEAETARDQTLLPFHFGELMNINPHYVLDFRLDFIILSFILIVKRFLCVVSFILVHTHSHTRHTHSSYSYSYSYSLSENSQTKFHSRIGVAFKRGKRGI